ncbi:uncharacterized protein [Penaeus vannamei]|uniref:uncharacterized protein n=1 Tax=Penaeus vannamei TaxID=6689 RepID=UPI00387F63E5
MAQNHERKSALPVRTCGTTTGLNSTVTMKPSSRTTVSGVDKLFPPPAPASDTQLSQAFTPTPIASSRHFDHSTPSEDSTLRAAHTLHSLSQESVKDANSDTQGGERQRGCVSFVEYTDRDYTPLSNGRRASYGDLHRPYTNLDHPSSVTDFCTLRRSTSRPREVTFSNALSPASVTDYHSSTRHLNGDTRRYSQHSLYSPTFSSYYLTSPPPPYTRSRKLGSPMDFSSPPEPITLSLTNSDFHLDRHDSKYIFSPEAIMKPGTLV